MAKEKNPHNKKQTANSKVRDSGSKLIFGNAELCSYVHGGTRFGYGKTYQIIKK